MDVKQLRFFVNVIEQGSFTKAARTLSVAQSVISHHVSELERDLGQQLLVRHGRGVIPTEAGTRLAEHARDILHQMETARAALTTLSDNPAGRVTIGLGSLIGRILAAPLIVQFREKYPEILLDFNEMPSVNIAEWLEMGRLNMGLMYPSAGFDKFPLRKIADVDLCLISPRTETSTDLPSTIAFKDITGIPLMLHEPRNKVPVGGWSPSGGAMRLFVEDAAANANVSLNIVGELSEAAGVSLILDLVKLGQCSTILPFHLVSDGRRQPDFTVQFIKSPALLRPLSLVFPSHRPLNGATQVVADTIEAFMVQRLAETRDRQLGSYRASNTRI